MTDSSSDLYTILDAALTVCGQPEAAAEVHGALTGVLCASPNADPRQGLAALAGTLENASEFQTSSLNEVFAATAEALTDDQFRFSPLLPDDDTALTGRAEALANWCQNFLYGFGSTGARPLSRQAREILHDLTEISQLDPRVEGEEDERAFAELVEFIRVSVQLLYAEALLSLEKEKRSGK